MTPVKFTRIERMAGIFLLTAFCGALVAITVVAAQRGWFSARIPYSVVLRDAEGLFIGTRVQMAGLRVGAIDEIELKSRGAVVVKFSVLKEYANQVRQDSVVTVQRPFVLSEKVLDLSIGDANLPLLNPGSEISARGSADLMDLLSGGRLGEHLDVLLKMSENLRSMAESLAKPERQKNFIRTLDNLTKLTDELVKILPQFSSQSPDLAKNLGTIAKNTAVLTDELQKFVPMMSKMAPEIPRASSRALEALDETVVTLKALQKTFLLRGNVRDVREEEQKR